MTRRMRQQAGVTAFVICLGALGACSAPVAAGPALTVAPDNVMVNTVVSVTGTGFSPGVAVQLSECGQTSWIAPQSPCTTDNAVTVVPDSTGRFVTGFKAEVCPRPAPITTPVTEAICYVGVIHPSGIDTIQLSPSTQLIVTYP